MQLGFTYITDEARDELEKLGVPHRRIENSWLIFTNPYDLRRYEFIERHSKEGGIELDYEPPEMKLAEYKAQGLRIWKSPDTGRYYYLIEGRVFVMEQKVKVDYSAMEPTRFVTTLFDIVDEYDQDHFRDILMKQVPNAESGRFI